MKRDMYSWLEEIVKSPRKKAMPVLSFPSTKLLGISVVDLISDSDKQAEGMRQIAKRVDSAASLSMMDLSVEAECFGSNIRFAEGEVPTVVGSIVSSYEDAEALKIPSVKAGRTGIYVEAIKKAVALIEDRPVLAGVIGPFSLAGRLMDVSSAMMYCFEEPEMVHLVLEKVTSFTIEYCKSYKAVGANGVVIAEPLAGLLSPVLAEEFSAPYVKRIVDAVQDENFIVVYHNCGGSTIQTIDSILSTGAKAFHFGNAIKMIEMLPHIPSDTVVLGNISPSGELCNGTPESVRAEVLALLEECGNYPNYVISSGCDIPPKTRWENIDAFFAAVSEYYDNKSTVA